VRLDVRTLVISDIHGNIDALESVLAAAGSAIDQILCLGDIVDYGPEPAACIELMREPVMRIRGNHDNAVAFHVDCGCGEAFRHLSIETREYMWRILSEEQTAWLGEVEPLLETEIDGRRIYAVHGAPSDPLFKYIQPDTPADELAREASLAPGADIILMGHTHKPFLKELEGRHLVNAGSVGQPRDGIAKASYAIIDNGRVELHRSEYDVERAMARVGKMPVSQKAREQLAYILKHATTPPEPPQEYYLPQCKCI